MNCTAYRWVRVCLVLVLCGTCVLAGEQTPMLRITPQGHTAAVTWLSFTPDGRQLVSAGYDKVVHVWDVSDPGRIRQVRSMRFEIGDGSAGMFYTGDLDAGVLALAGYGGAVESPGRIVIADFATGQIKRVLRGHRDVVDALALSADGRLLVSGSADKTIRLWDLATGRTVLTIKDHQARVFDVELEKLSDGSGYLLVARDQENDLRLWRLIGDSGQWQIKPMHELVGHQGLVRQTAVSADGSLLASAGYDQTIRLWRVSDGKLLRVLSGHEGNVTTVAFSPDGQLLVSGSSKPFDCRLWRVSDGRQLARFDKHNQMVRAAAFSPAGKLIATCGGEDQDIWLWSTDGKSVGRIVGLGGAVDAVAFSPDGKQVAWGASPGGGQLDVEMPLQHVFDLVDVGPVGAVQPAPRWRRAVREAGGMQVQAGLEPNELIVKRADGSSCVIRLPDRWDRIRCYSLTPGGRYILIGSEFTLSMHSTRTGQMLRQYVGHVGAVNSLALGDDGRYMISGSDDQTMRWWNLTAPGVKPTPRRIMPPEFVRYIENKGWGAHLDSAEGWSKLRRLFSLDPALAGYVNSLADPAEQVTPLLSIFVASDRRWVAWTPQGYYKSSVGGDKLIGWQVNRGADRKADFYEAWQFSRRLEKPALIDRLWRAGSVAGALALAQQEAVNQSATAVVQVDPVPPVKPEPNTQTPPVKPEPNPQTPPASVQPVAPVNLVQMAPPRVSITSPAAGLVTEDPTVRLQASIQPAGEEPVRQVTVLVNGRPINSTRSIVVRARRQPKPDTAAPDKPAPSTGSVDPAAGVLSADQKGRIDVAVPLVPGVNRISVLAATASATSRPVEVTVTRKVVDRAMLGKPNLYVVAIGVSRYQDNRLNLAYAASDAKAFVQAMAGQEGKMYAQVRSKLLVDDQATRANVLGAFEWLAGQATQQDVVMVMLAGHGQRNNRGSYFFIPYDVKLDHVNTTAVHWARIIESLAGLPGKVVLAMDTCHAGAVTGGGGDLTSLIKAMTGAEAGIIVLSSSDGRELSQESGDWGHGAFAVALIEGLTGNRLVASPARSPLPADFDRNREVEVDELSFYVATRVRELTGGAQNPRTERGGMQSFALTVLAEPESER